MSEENKVKDVVKQAAKARLSGVPLIAIDTSEPRALMNAISKEMQESMIKGELTKTPVSVLQWDFVNGFGHLNDIGQDAVREMNDRLNAENDGPPVAIDTTRQDPVAFTQAIDHLPQDSCVFVLNTHNLFKFDGFSQGVWNLRDSFKANGNILIMLSPLMMLPSELKDDVIVFDDPLPTEKELREIIERCHNYANAEINKDTIGRAVDALRGLNPFTVEQATAMNFERRGKGIGKVELNLDGVWSTKRKLIEQTNGLAIHIPTESWNDIKGNDNVKRFTYDLLVGEERPACIVWLDEFEKATQGVKGGDLSGVSDDQLQVTLQEMEDNQYDGQIFVGHPGGGKSMVAKCAGQLAGIPTIKFDLGAVKAAGGGFQGGAEREIREAFKVIKAVSGGRALFIATCNGIATLPPELRARFTFGTFMFDFFNEEEREAAWSYHIGTYKKKGLSDAQCEEIPDFDRYTGREIRNICKIAYRTNRTLMEAKELVSPYATTDPKNVNDLQDLADGRFIDAAFDGLYRKPNKKKRTNRNIQN